MSFQFGNAHILFQLRLNVPKLESNWKKIFMASRLLLLISKRLFTARDKTETKIMFGSLYWDHAANVWPQPCTFADWKTVADSHQYLALMSF